LFAGTPGWIRTSGFQLRRLTLYPLSYGRIKNGFQNAADTRNSNSNAESSQAEIGIKVQWFNVQASKVRQYENLPFV
jgi:hypothetical protein